MKSIITVVVSLSILTPQSTGLLAPSPYRCRQVGHLACRKLDADEINERLRINLERMKERDRKSQRLSKEDLNIAYEDDFILVVDKPSGVLSISKDENIPSLAKTVFDAYGASTSLTMGQMVVHRLGMDTSGLIIFCKTIEAVREMHTLFRSRQVSKQYEALLCGHIQHEEGLITMPLMRDFDVPPYMRVSTRSLQQALATLEPKSVPEQFLQAPKPCLTKYKVLALEEIGDGLPVTRVSLTSISGRTHQLNVHCAALGHPIVADNVYGWNGEASPNGGRPEQDMKNPDQASQELQKQIAEATKDRKMCVHATLLNFRHPVTKTDISIRSPAPF